MIDVYLGRQHILNKELNTFFYEIAYYTDGNGGNSVGRNSISSALTILQSILDVGVQRLTQGLPALFPLTADFIIKQKYLPFQSDVGGVILSLEDDQITDTLVAAIRRLIQQQYIIVVDQIHVNRHTIPLLHEISYARIDRDSLSFSEMQGLMQQLKKFNIHMIINNVSDHQTFENYKALGFEYFQGMFFTTPQIFHGKSLPSRRLFVLKMLSSLYNPEIDIRDLEIIIRQDVSMGYKLMRMVNSVYYGLNSQIESIQHALVLLGINPLRSWLSVILISEIDDQPGPLMSTAIIRGKMCELLGEKIPEEDGTSYFITGLFSILDTMMGMSMPEILETIPMAEKINLALLHREGNLGRVLQSVIAYEQNQWQQINLPKISIQEIREAYLKAIAWTTELTNSNLL
jgi:c-di-GMP phosphodiesterase